LKIGIVGAEGAKFTELGQARAREIIALYVEQAESVCSGDCHLGGIDIWTREHCKDIGKPFTGYAPAKLSWEEGYKPRNLQIARNSDKVICIAVDKLPAGFKGMTFKSCYHCAKHWPEAPPHVKGGGCWTMYQAKKMGKEWKLIVVNNE
jgi:hypothetical protein